ncbi:MAG TPA: helix-turn-helix transcriptional regulator [Nocardioides sp.]|uniref:PadR family transcriptional regulator n=1 Tax=Nocardioides sp. TaxID=35761 RepID=UPI002D7EF923|nr:helix-turn-helix transcriptional regulator [Nocardioides sp.]HET6652884.1 helix-turn-helix transcriptional regulator [Nocardioides sp.]
MFDGERGPRMTIPTQLVLQVLLADAEVELYGGQIGSAAGLPSGTVHPILARLEGVGWVESRWEDVDPSQAGRPARRYYRLTAAGANRAPAALLRASRPRRAGLAPHPLPGQ